MSAPSPDTRKFPPTPEFVAQANLSGVEAYKAAHKRSLDDPEGFWGDIASELTWMKPWDKVLDDSKAPVYEWFVGGKTNVTVNCLDRHVANGLADQPAILWEGEPADETRVLTYGQLLAEVERFANVLKALGVGKGDGVSIYLPMIPELAISVLACARIGAVHSVIFAGFSAESIKDRVMDQKSKLVITADGGWRRGKALMLKDIVDEGVADCSSIEKVLVVQRHLDKEPFPHTWNDRDVWYHEIAPTVPAECAPEEMDAEDMLFLLYTSGSTGKPKGVMHTTGGYMVYTYLTSKLTFDLKPGDVYWCTADVGWITGHSYIVYGILQNGVAQVMYEGAPNSPDESRFWQIVEKYKVSIFYTAPTAIRAFMKWGDQHVVKHDLSSLRLLGTVGEPINPEAWMWYHRLIGAEKCPIVDTWWQTETGGHMLTPLPGVTATKPGSATTPFLGIDAAVLDEDGNETDRGILAIRKPWPAMLRGVWGDEQRFKDTYWCKWGGKYYFPGDGAIKDEDGYFWITGRVDDVVNVSGHRIGTAELESVFVEHPAVAESAVIGVPHEIKGQGLVAFVIIRTGVEGEEAVWRKELTAMVDSKIGKFARPEKIVFSADLPKTRSGKIMRRLLRDIAEDRPLGNVTTLADPSVVDNLKEKFKA
ncbi:acetate--CoA ligase [Cerasicoccus arenae]|uniref:Acetyl-coenzyme A synthetase n=1 Tax=Cerasicoccus arenae TaxID=424488 RepID=A0A8J3DF54_9BACT|nr:acetate--CoA ligase [Cerasicoccus arenae]MBK1857674.1 acetate--CoA ligase [Cerasicoccus arenae]GHB91457.1 acetyl-coenzyme A synthetase [Cerasicoccus arenae]